MPTQVRPTSAVVGTLNLFGEQRYNPFELLSDDKALMANHGALQDRALSMTWDEFAAECGDVLIELARRRGPQIMEALQQYTATGSVWSFFQHPTKGADALKNDGRLLEPRLNMMTFAMRGVGREADVSSRFGNAASAGATSAQWNLLDHWQSEMEVLLRQRPSVLDEGDVPLAYATDPALIVWDLACNCVCALEVKAYRAICASTPLNPTNLGAIGPRFFSAASSRAGEQPLILGLQVRSFRRPRACPCTRPTAAAPRLWNRHLTMLSADSTSLLAIRLCPGAGVARARHSKGEGFRARANQGTAGAAHGRRRRGQPGTRLLGRVARRSQGLSDGGGGAHDHAGLP